MPSFNPRARGGRDATYFAQNAGEAVSIHAPAGGATRIFNCPASLRLFQSTRPRGARHQKLSDYWQVAKVSIHAPAGGATQRICQPYGDDQSFNPRARGGRDESLRNIIYQSLCFNPRARGGRDTLRA